MSFKSVRHIAVIAVSSTFLGFAASWIWSPDIAAQSVPAMGKAEFENESIAVVRIHMEPHEKTPMHDIPSARLVIWLTDARLNDTGADGSAIEYSRPAGSIDWITPRRHSGENLSDQALEFLAIIPKAGAAPASHRAHPR